LEQKDGGKAAALIICVLPYQEASIISHVCPKLPEEPKNHKVQSGIDRGRGIKWHQIVIIQFEVEGG
jgi:hypothetical protein